MLQDLKNQRTNFEPDALRSRKRLKENQPKNVSYGKKTCFLPSLYNKWPWLQYGEAEASVYCIICQNADHFSILNDIRVENSFIKTRSSLKVETSKNYRQRFSSR